MDNKRRYKMIRKEKKEEEGKERAARGKVLSKGIHVTYCQNIF